MAATLSSVTASPLHNGQVIVAGRVTLSNVYVTATGEVMDLSAYCSGSPMVVLSGDDGYVLEHNRGNAAAGAVIARFANGGAAAGAALIGVTNATDLSAVIGTFIAIGASVLS